MKSRDAAKLLNQELESLLKRYEEVPKKVQQITFTEAKKQSSGTVTLVQMAQMWHPYGLGPRAMSLPLLPIHKHDGEFYNAWKKEGSAGDLKVTNNSKMALWLDKGTKRMKARGISRYLQDFADKKVEEMANAITKDFNGA